MSLETWTGAASVRSNSETLKNWRQKASMRGRGRKPSLRPESRFLLSLSVAGYAALALYCLLSVVFGESGLLAYGKLEERRTAMEANLLSLEKRHDALASQLEALKSDPERAAMEARSLGYLRRGEREILFAPWHEKPMDLDPGSVLPYAENAGLPDASLKEICFGVFLAVLALWYAPKKRLERVGRRGKA